MSGLPLDVDYYHHVSNSLRIEFFKIVKQKVTALYMYSRQYRISILQIMQSM